MKPPLHPVVRVWLILLSLLGLAISAWLSYQKLSGHITSLVGCGQESGCSHILGSKWSVVFKVIPVSLFSLGVYGILLIHVMREYPWSQKIRAGCAWLLLLAVIWFVGLQVFLFHQFCPYCMASHGIGLFTALLLLGEKANLRAWKCAVSSLGLMSLLALIQIFGDAPDTHLLSDASQIKSLETLSPSHSENGSFEGERVFSFLNGKKTFVLKDVPHIGDPNAQYMLAEYFDYTCKSCQATHLQFKELMKKHPHRYGLILLPVPLNPDCNPYFPLKMPEHQQACFLAHYAMTIWVVAPEKFTEYHDWLMTAKPSEKEAKKKAESLVGEKVFYQGLRDKRVRVLFEQNINDYKVLAGVNPVMPKLLVGESLLMHGRAKNVDALSKTLRDVLMKRGRSHEQ